MQCSHNDCLWSFQREKSLRLHKLKHKFSLDSASNQTAGQPELEKKHNVIVCLILFWLKTKFTKIY